MKVALIVEWLDAWRGGAETSTGQFLGHLVELGVAVDVYTRSASDDRPGIHVHTIAVSGPSRAFKTLAFCKRADRQVVSGGYDLVHAISPSMAADVYQPRGGTYAESFARNLAVRRSRGARLLKRVTQWVDIKQRMLLRFERRMFARPDRPIVIALSDYVVRQLTEHYGLPPERIRKVFNAVNRPVVDGATRERDRREVRRKYGVADDELLVLMVAHNFKLKGLRTWIDALAVARESRPVRIKSLVVGKENAAGWLRLVKRRGLADVMRFVGPTDHISAFYHAADALVHPTFYDPCSRVVLEALAHGLPVITSRFDGAAELVRDWENGFVLHSPGDVDDLANMVLALAVPGRRHAMAAAALSAGTKVDMRRHAEEVFEVYQTILNGRSTR